MKKNKLHLAFLTLLTSFSCAVFAQNIGINTTGAAPNAAAILDLNTGNAGTMGMLPEQVALTATNLAGPIALPPTGLIVYNTATAGASPTNVTPGYYFNAGTGAAPNWVQFVAGNSNSTNIGGWLLNGNTGTNPVNNFVGTTDANALNFRTNNIQQMTILSGGNVGINTAAPLARLEVNSLSGTHAIYGHTPNTGAYIAYETPFTFGVPLQTINGAGVWSANPLAGYTSAFAQSTGAANIAADINFSSVWIAAYNYVQNASVTFNPMAVYGQLNVTGATLGGIQTAIEGFMSRGATAGNPGYSAAVLGVAVSQNESTDAIMGVTYCDVVANNNTCIDCGGFMTAGGYFETDNYAGSINNDYAYVAADQAGIGRKIIGSGSNSEIVPTPTHGRITLTCPESPEYWYQDYGTVKLVNGKAHVDLDPILSDIIFVNDSNPIRVFCTPVDMLNFNGVCVINRTVSGFDIVELNGGSHSGTLDYQLVAKPRTNYGEGRFMQAPGPVGAPKDPPPPLSVAKNQPDHSKIWHWQPDNVIYDYKLPKHNSQQASKQDGTN